MVSLPEGERTRLVGTPGSREWAWSELTAEQQGWLREAAKLAAEKLTSPKRPGATQPGPRFRGPGAMRPGPGVQGKQTSGIDWSSLEATVSVVLDPGAFSMGLKPEGRSANEFLYLPQVPIATDDAHAVSGRELEAGVGGGAGREAGAGRRGMDADVPGGALAGAGKGASGPLSGAGASACSPAHATGFESGLCLVAGAGDGGQALRPEHRIRLLLSTRARASAGGSHEPLFSRTGIQPPAAAAAAAPGGCSDRARPELRALGPGVAEEDDGVVHAQSLVHALGVG